jgi:hypothetical protein
MAISIRTGGWGRSLVIALLCVWAAARGQTAAQNTQASPPSGHDHSQHGAAPKAAKPDGQASSKEPAMPGMAGMDHGPMSHESMSPSQDFLMRESSGTGLQPSAWPMPMLMTRAGAWNLMWMGQAYIVATQQSGPRGGDKVYSPNWGMLGAVHSVGGGTLMLRSMLSLDPATVTNRRYPLLFQSGETAFGTPLTDAQHPHDFIMELSAQYARSLGDKGVWNVYYAPVGDPALGPVAYPHRASAMELPQAALGHHWQDSTHIANNVLTAGLSYGKVRVEASGFVGREPNENRWNIDWAAMDSWSTRLSVFPTRNWAGQFSIGRLRDPEATHPGDVVRTTASVEHVRPAAGGNFWATSLVWGQNYKRGESLYTNAVLAETVVPFRRRNFVTGRFEWSQRDELFASDHELEQRMERETGRRVFDVSAFTAGYTRDIQLFRDVQTGIGANVSSYLIASELKPYYGSHPWGLNVFIRVRLKPTE